MRRHAQTHCEIKPYKCKMCGFMQKRRDHIVSHINAVHKGEIGHGCDNFWISKHLVEVNMELSEYRNIVNSRLKICYDI